MSPQFGSGTMDPTATTFMPAANLLSPGLNDPAPLSETLCKALANEQSAHSTTKAALVDHITRRVELEDQLKTNKQTIASMNTTIKNLGAIIKHNATKQTPVSAASSKQTECSEDPEEIALRAYYREFRRLKKMAEEKKQCIKEEQLMTKTRFKARNRPRRMRLISSLRQRPMRSSMTRTCTTWTCYRSQTRAILPNQSCVEPFGSTSLSTAVQTTVKLQRLLPKSVTFFTSSSTSLLNRSMAMRTPCVRKNRPPWA